MCGIAGITGNRLNGLEAMTAQLAHRGPDDAGVWSDMQAGVGLAHRRLSILDLSPAGHQPMSSPSGRYTMVFNGEIYNHLDIRKELEIPPGPTVQSGTLPLWRGHSDTETLLAGFDQWGVLETLRKSIGMFALAVWDKTERTLAIARDRMGEKPLYYGWNRGSFLFASELKAMRAIPGFDAVISRASLALMLRHDYVPAPYSIYRGIFKLWPGSLLTIRPDCVKDCPWMPEDPPFDDYQVNGLSLHRFWSLKEAALRGQRNLFCGTDCEAVDELERILGDAVQSQQLSDVPLGAFLSGGIDSSSIVALMQARSGRPVKSFTIGFHEKMHNEADYAKEIARHLGTDHTELYVTPQDALNVIPGLSRTYDEPFSDSSQIPTFLVSRLTRQHVTVSLSGDGGDELFGGYNRYFNTPKVQRLVNPLPLFCKKALAGAILHVSPDTWDRIYTRLEAHLPPHLRVANFGDKTRKLPGILFARSPEEIYRFLISQWKSPAEAVIGADEPETMLTKQELWGLLPDTVHQMMLLDSLTYLPDDILVKVDRAAMAVSLETRVPFLDQRVIEFAWRLPLSLKLRDGQGKWILRQLLYRHVPSELVERPKMGFSMPLDQWLRGPLRDWAESLLETGRLACEGYFHQEVVRNKWREHLSGKRNWAPHLWSVLMFQAWLDDIRSMG